MKTIQIILFLIIPASLFAQPQRCGEDPQMTSFCKDACIICDIDGYTGRHQSTIVGEAPVLFAGECTDIAHNLQWIAFIAGSTNLKISMSVINCDLGRGLEFGLYKGRNCSGYVRVSNCFGGATNVIKPGSFGIVENNEPLIIGEYYYIVMDGAAGDNCNWQFNVLEGETKLDPLETSGEIIGDSIACLNSQRRYQVESPVGATEFIWTINGMSVSRTDRFPYTDIDLITTGENMLCVTAYNACHRAPPTCKKIYVPPIPVIQLTEEICEGDNFMVADTMLSTSGDYEFHVPTSFGCDSIIFVNLETIAAPVTNLGQLNICKGDTLPIGGEKFIKEGIYEKRINNTLGCDSTIQFELTLIDCDIQGATENTNISCVGANDASITFEITNGTPPFSYQLTTLNDDEVIIGTIEALNTSETIQDLPTGIYLINIMDDFSNQEILIEAIENPAPIIINLIKSDYNNFGISCYTASDGQIEIFPEGGTPPYSYSWENGTKNSKINTLLEGAYLVTITDQNNCQLVDTIILEQPAPLTLNYSSIVPNCQALNSGEININTTTGGVPPYLYKLGDKSFDSRISFNNLESGDYTLDVLDANGCLITENITLSAPIIPKIDLGADKVIRLGESIELIPKQIEGVNLINWRVDSTLSCYNCVSPIANPINRKTFSVTTTSIDNCTASDSITIEVVKIRNVYVPNVFSPNGDGINDEFYIKTGLEADKIISLQIFTRWGEKIYEIEDIPPNDSNFSWDGTLRNQNMDTGVYLWQAAIQFIDGEVMVQTGDITLIR